MLVDTHTHLYDSAFGDAPGQDAAVERAIAASVERMVVPDENSLTRSEVLDLCGRWPGRLFPCAGIHPTEFGDNADREIRSLADFLETRRKEVCAIGECGMDLYWSRDNIREQERVLRAQLDLSLQYSLPLIIHARDAIEPIFRILEDYRGKGLRGVFHAWSGSMESFRSLDKYGEWYVGIGGVVTFRKAAIGENVREIPLERILLETDSPYLTPVPHRGERNESAYIPIIANFVAGKKNVELPLVSEVTGENARRLFF